MDSIINYKEIRQMGGLTQREIAKLMGWSQPQVSNLESGKVTPTVDSLVRYAKAAGVELAITAKKGNQKIVTIALNSLA